jgi:predicted amidohydrolase
VDGRRIVGADYIELNFRILGRALSTSGSIERMSWEQLRVACVQMRTGPDMDANVEAAGRHCAEAAARGADLVVLPEKWPAFGAPDVFARCAQPLDGPLVQEIASWARRLGVAIVAGSVSERVSGSDRVRNASVALDREGRLVASYGKIHLFDVDVDGRRVRESDSDMPGDELVLCELCGVPVALTICYDIRFPELFASYASAGAELFTVPAAFLERTGLDHWEVLLRARAIETQSFVVAAAQWGELPGGYRTYGRSLICDPWGTVLAQAADGEGVIVADLQRSALQRIRMELPSLRHRRPEVYASSRGLDPVSTTSARSTAGRAQ